ncbi:MAG: flagellar biosynthesis protein FlhF [Acidobacteria bacterium]|nr:MAG: flagellar biosynthesis protein FlhF [Acidobacteriota bacterium]PIE90465.1 MAG: flagellar biosynthesis protein FlhF [Acidobacteriota bacterium]
MKIKKFEASTMKEALEKIKVDMGPDAFILATKNITKKGPLGFGERPFLQVTAAIEEDKISTLDLTEAEEPEWPGKQPVKEPEQTETAPTYNSRGSKTDFSEGFDAVFNHATTPKSESKPLRKELLELKKLIAGMNKGDDSIQPLKAEIADLKNLLYSMAKQTSSINFDTKNPALIATYHHLKDKGIEEVIAGKLVQMADRKMNAIDKSNIKKNKQFIRQLIKQTIQVAPPLQFEDGQTKMVAFVGPTGVGKTTTLAKLAAYSALHLREKVAFITLDTYRIAAVDQLKTYAKIMDIPVQVALNVHELQQAIQFHQDKSLILIDTAGRSQNNQTGIRELEQFFSNQEDIDIHLVLSATTKGGDLTDIINQFEVLNPKYLAFTKLDETRSYGSFYTQIIKTKKPVSYLTTGQSVPEDLEFASIDMLSGLFMGTPLEELQREAH